MVKSVRDNFGLLNRLWSLNVWYSFSANVSCVDLGNILQSISKSASYKRKPNSEQDYNMNNDIKGINFTNKTTQKGINIKSISVHVLLTKPHPKEQWHHQVSEIIEIWKKYIKNRSLETNVKPSLIRTITKQKQQILKRTIEALTTLGLIMPS